MHGERSASGDSVTWSGLCRVASPTRVRSAVKTDPGSGQCVIPHHRLHLTVYCSLFSLREGSRPAGHLPVFVPCTRGEGGEVP